MLTQTQTSASSSVLPPPLYRYHPSAFPPVLPCLPHPPYRPSLRHPLWCPPNQPPTRSLVALPPAAAAAATAAVAPPPRPCRLSTHRPAKPLVAVPPSHPTYRLPHYPAASDPHPSPLARQPPACRPTPLRFARLSALSVSSLFRLPSPVAALVLFSLPPVLPLPRDARRHPLRATSTPESRALWNTTGSSAIIFCPIVCRACMRARECERDEGNGERMRERTAI